MYWASISTARDGGDGGGRGTITHVTFHRVGRGPARGWVQLTLEHYLYLSGHVLQQQPLALEDVRCVGRWTGWGDHYLG